MRKTSYCFAQKLYLHDKSGIKCESLIVLIILLSVNKVASVAFFITPVFACEFYRCKNSVIF